MKITTIKPNLGIPKVRTITVGFEFCCDAYTYQIEAEVEVDAPDSYTCTHINGADEVNDHVYQCIKEMAEEKAWTLDNQPKNPRSGCQCPPYVDGRTTHDADCPLKLQGAEREAYIDLLAKESRRSSYDEARQRLLDENTEIYLTLK